MDNTVETPESYTAKEFGKDVAKEAARAAAEVAAAYALLGAIGFTYQKLQDRKARRKAK